jgi:mannose-6-phosphate isomerase-like protein (cupin superfamily)
MFDCEQIKFVPKGWGFEKWLVNNEEYCGKLLYMVKNRKLSWHYHIQKKESFYIQSGKVLIKYSENDNIESAKSKILESGDVFHVSRLMRHQLIALEDSEIFEFSTTHYDEDSYRIMKGDQL